MSDPEITRLNSLNNQLAEEWKTTVSLLESLTKEHEATLERNKRLEALINLAIDGRIASDALLAQMGKERRLAGKLLIGLVRAYGGELYIPEQEIIALKDKPLPSLDVDSENGFVIVRIAATVELAGESTDEN